MFFFTNLLVINFKVYIFADLFQEGLLFYAENVLKVLYLRQKSILKTEI